MCFPKKIKIKDVKKSYALSIAFSALCGITEPALFGITLRNKKTLIAVMTGGFCGALFAGIMSCKAYGFVGGLPSLPLFLDPKGGFSNLIVTIISITIGFTVSLVLTVALNKRGQKNV
jgi:PTS system beta-glucosides-specific IIC component